MESKTAEAQPPPYSAQGQPEYSEQPQANQDYSEHPSPAAQPQGYYGDQNAGYPPHSGYAQPPPGAATATTVVFQPPATIVTGPVRSKPNNYLALSFFNLLCCIFLLGVIAIIFSSMVDSAWSSGNYQQARCYSNIAMVLNIIGIVVGILLWIGVGIAYVVANTAINRQ